MVIKRIAAVAVLVVVLACGCFELILSSLQGFGYRGLSRFFTRRNIPRAAESLLFFIEFRQISVR